MLTLARGQKQKLAELTPATQLQARLEFGSKGLNFDFSCFGLDDNGQLCDDRYFIFFNQKAAPQKEIVLSSLSCHAARFELDLARLPNSVRRLVFVATVDGAGEMNALQTGRFVLSANGRDVGEFAFAGADFSTEKAVMVSEIYFKSEWRIAANGQGFKEGLNAVLKHFGGQESEEVAPVPAQTAPPQTVNLTKAGASVKVQLSKNDAEMVATAQWVDNGDASDDNDDLDMRAALLYPDGRMSIVTCDNLGSLQKAPFILHGGDVQSASQSAPGEENMRVNAAISQKLGGPVAIVFSVYSAVTNGVVSIASLKPKMSLRFGAQMVNCQLDFLSKTHNREDIYTYVLGVAIIRGGEVEIQAGGQFSKPGSEETLWLQWDKKGGVTLTMDGPHVFKGEPLDDFDLGNGKKYV